MTNQLALLGVFAHPDDEGSCGGSLGQAAAQGHRAYVAVATRGDGVDAKISDPALATRETLAEVRSAEMACACAKLGLQPPIFLGYQDGEVDHVPLEDAGRAVARLIRELQINIVITHDPLGGYGHHDHIAVSAFTTRAYELAGDAAVDLGLPAFAPSKLYYTAIPRSFLESVPAFRERRADIRGQALGFVGVPDEEITTEVPIGEWVTRKLEALSCHRTQFEFDKATGQPKLFTTSLPEPQRTQLFGHERFVLARSSVPTTGRESDLWAGLA
jgi:LmbE family N-acetylglucosaminyl deacetylase